MQPIVTKEGRKLVLLVVGSYFIHIPFNIANMQILTCKLRGLIVIGGLKKPSFINTIFPFIIEVKARWRAILTHYLKNWMEKNKDKWPFNCLSWKSWTNSLMKHYISHSGALCISMAIGIKWCPSWISLYL
jgi:hypothetical protein